MKQILLTVIGLMIALNALASNSFRGEDFDNMIKENQKAETELRTKLQKDAGIRFDDQPGKISREKLAVGNEGVEQIAVSTSDMVTKTELRNRRSAAINKRDDQTAAKRLAQEFKEAN